MRSKPLLHIIAITFYILLAIIITYPLIINITKVIGTGPGDINATLWELWWFHKALSEGKNPYFSELQFYPNGTELYFQSLSPANTFLALPFLFVGFSPITVCNLLILINFVFGGYAQFLLARYLNISYLPALLVGAIFTFGPYHFSHTAGGHFHLTNIHWFSLHFLFLLKYLDTGNGRYYPWIAGWCFVLATLSTWYEMVFGGLMNLFVLFGYLITDRTKLRDTKFWVGLLKIPVLFLVVLSPLLSKMIYLKLTKEYAPGHSSWFWSADLLTLFLPNGYSAYANIITNWKRWTGNSTECSGFLGYTLLLLSLYSCIKGLRYARLFFITTLFFAILQLGPYLHINGKVYWNIPLPYRTIERYFPVIKFMGCPGRAALVTQFLMSLTSGFALTQILGKLSILRATLALVLASMITIEYLPGPYPLTPIKVPAFLQSLGKVKDNCTIFDRSSVTDIMLYQIYHKKPIIYGHIARDPMPNRWFIQKDPILNQIADPPGYKVKALERIDPKIDFIWRKNSPHPNLQPDFFEVYWKGYLVVPEWGIYRFKTLNDDGVELRIDGKVVISDWWPHPPIENIGEKWLNKGNHLIELRYFEAKHFAVIRLYWAKGDNEFKIVPPTNLRTEDGKMGLKGVYFNKRDNLPYSRTEIISRLRSLNICYIVKPWWRRQLFERYQLNLPIVSHQFGVYIYKVE